VLAQGELRHQWVNAITRQLAVRLSCWALFETKKFILRANVQCLTTFSCSALFCPTLFLPDRVRQNNVRLLDYATTVFQFCLQKTLALPGKSNTKAGLFRWRVKCARFWSICSCVRYSSPQPIDSSSPLLGIVGDERTVNPNSSCNFRVTID